MKTTRLRHLIILILSCAAFPLVSSTGCVSINLPDGEVEPADYTYQSPAAPFIESERDGPGKAWINQENGNSLSVFSNCSPQEDPSLSILQEEAISTIERAKLLESQSLLYNRRSALISEVSGQVDGVPVKMKVLIFKKNNCHYKLSYVGVDSAYRKNLSAFDQFLKSFEAP